MTSPIGVSLHFDCRHLGFLEPEVTIYGQEGGAEAASLVFTVPLQSMVNYDNVNANIR